LLTGEVVVGTYGADALGYSLFVRFVGVLNCATVVAP